jgi:small subunit ribosomal protein S27Ae
MPAPAKKPAAKGAAPAKKKSYSVSKLYEVKGDTLVRKNPWSPKADGVFMAVHKDRVTCGKTGYTEFKK